MPEIIRTKRFVVKPMDLKETQMQLELLGHQFFVFRNASEHEVFIETLDWIILAGVIFI